MSRIVTTRQNILYEIDVYYPTIVHMYAFPPQLKDQWLHSEKKIRCRSLENSIIHISQEILLL